MGIIIPCFPSLIFYDISRFAFQYQIIDSSDSSLQYVILIRIGARCRNVNQNDLFLPKKIQMLFYLFETAWQRWVWISKKER